MSEGYSLEESLEERLPELDSVRVERVVAAASTLSERVLADGHLSTLERKQVRRALSADFTEEEIDWILEVLDTEQLSLRMRANESWVALGTWLLGKSATGENAPDPAQYAHAELAVRWPMLLDERRAQRVRRIEATDAGIQVDPPHSLSSFLVPWLDLLNLEPVQPWPEVLLEWQEGKETRRVRVAPRGDARAFDAAVEALVAAAEARVPHERLPTGWLRHSKAVWEDVEALPRAPTDDARDERPASPTYRFNPGEREKVIAVRAPRGGLGVMAEWVATRLVRGFRDGVQEAVLTDRYLYVRRRSGAIQRVALAFLTEGSGTVDRVYRFGRDAAVVLPDRRTCAVCEGLDALLLVTSPADDD